MKHSFEEKFIDACVLVMVVVFTAFAFIALSQEFDDEQEVGKKSTCIGEQS